MGQPVVHFEIIGVGGGIAGAPPGYGGYVTFYVAVTTSRPGEGRALSGPEVFGLRSIGRVESPIVDVKPVLGPRGERWAGPAGAGGRGGGAHRRIASPPTVRRLPDDGPRRR